jgi:hypothetical protein
MGRIMMTKESAEFTWIVDTSFMRSRGGVAGRCLEKGATYNVSEFDAAVVAEWVRTGAAKYTKPGKQKPEEEV